MAMPIFAQGAQYRKKLKEYKKEGWDLFGSSKTINDALRELYEALTPDNLVHQRKIIKFMP